MYSIQKILSRSIQYRRVSIFNTSYQTSRFNTLIDKSFLNYSQYTQNTGENKDKYSRIDHDFQKKLQHAYSMKNLLEIYKQNQQKITPLNVYFLAREIQTRFYSEDSKSLKSNQLYQDLLNYLESNLEKMPSYTLVEILTVYRKSYQNGHLDQDKTLKIAKRINELLVEDSKKPNSKLNPKLVSQAYLDLCILEIIEEHWIILMKNWLYDQKYTSYFTSQQIYNMFKSTEFYKKRKHSDFYYQLSVKAIEQIQQFDIDRLCVLFKNISNLQLHFNTTHSRLPQILIAIKDEIQKNLDENFDPKNGIAILDGYQTAPHSLSNSLLEKVSKKMLKYLDDEKLNTRQIVQFLELMGKQREGFKLNAKQLQNLYRILKKQLELKDKIYPSFCLQIIQSMHSQEFSDLSIIRQIDQQIQNFKDISFTMKIKLLTGMLKLKYDASSLRQSLSQQFEQDTNQSFEKLLQLIYIFNYKIDGKPTDHLQYQELINKFTQSACDKIKQPDNNEVFIFFMDTFGNHYTAQRMESYRLINQQFYDTYVKIYETLDMNQLSHSLLNVCNWSLFGIKWTEQITHILNKQQDDQLFSWILSRYLNDNNKIYPKTNVFLQACLSPKINKSKFFLEKIRCFLHTPYICFISKKGTTNPLLVQAFEKIDLEKINFQELNISCNQLIKCQRYFDILNVESNFFIRATIQIFEQNEEKFLEKNQEFFAAEIAQFLIQNEDKVQQTNYYDRMKEVVIKIQKTLDLRYEQTNQNFGFSFLQKYVEITAWLSEKKYMNIEKQQLDFLVEQLLQKLRNSQQENFVNQIMNSIFTLALLDAQGMIKLETFNQEFLLDLFSKTLNNITIEGFKGYLEGMKTLKFTKDLQKQKANDNNNEEKPQQIDDNKLLYRFFKKIEYFYISKNTGKQPYVVTEFTNFFSTFKQYYPSPQIYNRLLQDILDLYPRLKIKHIQEILKNLANIKLYHKQILSLFYSNFQDNLNHYRSSFQDMIWSFAQLGYIHDYETNKKEQSSSSSEDGSESSDDETITIEKCLEQYSEFQVHSQYKIIWAMIFYNIQTSSKDYFIKLLDQQLQIMTQEKQVLSIQSMPYILDVISYCLLNDNSLLGKNPENIEKVIKISNTLQQIVQKGKQYKKLNEDDVQQKIVNILESKKSIQIKKDYIFEEFQLMADIFIEEEKTIILLDQNEFVNYDQQTLTGRGQIRKRYFEKFVSQKNDKIKSSKSNEIPYKLINLSCWKLKNAGKNEEDLINYLKKIILL